MFLTSLQAYKFTGPGLGQKSASGQTPNPSTSDKTEGPCALVSDKFRTKKVTAYGKDAAQAFRFCTLHIVHVPLHAGATGP